MVRMILEKLVAIYVTWICRLKVYRGSVSSYSRYSWVGLLVGWYLAYCPSARHKFLVCIFTSRMQKVTSMCIQHMLTLAKPPWIDMMILLLQNSSEIINTLRVGELITCIFSNLLMQQLLSKARRSKKKNMLKKMMTTRSWRVAIALISLICLWYFFVNYY